ncbi:MAG: hypothetical protein A3F69_00375 [Acidobacteria bacterium RIFCSPLOWO2_12_FULL_66_10]|nr:MAG: hypothetical protein A3F69_00375 [Acidobacteria bacterium RIFCSPLOWO2_12_FULL_66_10]
MPESGVKHGIHRYDWDAIAGIVAAAVALVLHFLHVVQPEILLTITLVLVALLLLRQLRHEAREERVEDSATRTEQMVLKLRDGLTPPEVVLIGPRHLRSASEAFARQARGEMVWFNVCLMMFRPQELFDCLLRPAVENPLVTRVEFVLDEGERTNWRDHVAPKLGVCRGREKVAEPRWCTLKESVSFVLADRESDGQAEAQLSFWGEPFMARSTGRDVPRFIFHVQAHSELVARLVELERSYRMVP